MIISTMLTLLALPMQAERPVSLPVQPAALHGTLMEPANSVAAVAVIRGRIRKGYQGIVADSGMDSAVVTPHWHRHTAAIWLMEANVPISRAAPYLSMTPRTLERVYGHHRPDHQSDVSAAFDRRAC